MDPPEITDQPWVRLEEVSFVRRQRLILDTINWDVAPGNHWVVLGANGSGKTTVFNVVTGFYKPTECRLLLKDKEISNFKPDRITKMGLTRIFQNSRVFRDLSVFDNVMIGHHLRRQTGPISSVARTPKYLKQDKHGLQGK